MTSNILPTLPRYILAFISKPIPVLESVEYDYFYVLQNLNVSTEYMKV